MNLCHQTTLNKFTSLYPHNPDCRESCLRELANSRFKRWSEYPWFCLHRSIFSAIISEERPRFSAACIMASQMCRRREYALQQSFLVRHFASYFSSSCSIDGPPGEMPILYSFHKSITVSMWVASRYCSIEFDSEIEIAAADSALTSDCENESADATRLCCSGA